MPAKEDVVRPEHESARLGALWRSQGDAFLEQQAEALIADLDRLRQAYVAALDAPAPMGSPAAPPLRRTLIDLRDPDVTGLVCTREAHSNVDAAARCLRCGYAFCDGCLVRPEATHGEPLCTECALVMGGVHHKRARPLVAPGRPGRSVPR
jgi:hypothetical protein